MAQSRIEIRIERAGRTNGADARIARLTIANERKLNTLDSALMEELAGAITTLAKSGGIRAAVLAGAGERAFIGGADIKEMSRLDQAGARAFITRLHRACEWIRDAPFPVIARMPGYTLGAGLEIAAACDLRVAAQTAVFGMPEVRMGIPSVIEAALLPSLIGWGRARRLLLLGEMIPAAQAESWGLVEAVVPAEALDATIDNWIKSILQAGPRAIKLQKSLIRKWEELPMSKAIEAGIDAFEAAFETDEPRRRMRDFLERKAR